MPPVQGNYRNGKANKIGKPLLHKHHHHDHRPYHVGVGAGSCNIGVLSSGGSDNGVRAM